MDNKEQMLDRLLALVPFDGWSRYAFDQAAKQTGLSPAEARRLFPGGVADALETFFRREDEALLELASALNLTAMRMPERIEALLMARLTRWLPWREAIRRAVAFRALPWNAAGGAASLYRSVDRMWYIAGDQSLDFSYYTKRMTLAGIYSAVLLFWLDDMSEDQADTRAFLKRRLGDVAAFGKWKKRWTAKFAA